MNVIIKLWYNGITTRAEYQGAFRSCAAFTNLLCGQSAPFYRTCVLAARVVTAASRKGRFAMKTGRKPIPIENRFWKYVNKTETCWNWTGHTIGGGYGAIRVNGVNRVAHRVSWELANGEIPNGLLVCHKCDNRVCVRPDHLFIGTQSDNILDCSRKGRMNRPKGENCSFSKLTIDQVKEIRISKLGTVYLGKIYGVNASTISKIRKGKRWKQ